MMMTGVCRVHTVDTIGEEEKRIRESLMKHNKLHGDGVDLVALQMGSIWHNPTSPIFVVQT